MKDISQECVYGHSRKRSKIAFSCETIYIAPIRKAKINNMKRKKITERIKCNSYYLVELRVFNEGLQL